MTSQGRTDRSESAPTIRLANEEFDALTDLFLGDLAGPARGANPASPSPHSPLHTPRPSPRLVADDTPADDPGPTSEPMRTPEQAIASSIAPAIGSSGVDHATPTRTSKPLWDPPRASEERPPTGELLITGHLPARAGLWVAQYSAQRARETGEPVALVRLVAGSLTVDLFGVERPESEDSHIESRTVHEAVRTARRHARRCIIQADETQSPKLLDDPRINTVTIITGANDAAVVDAYRAIKGIAVRSERRDTPPTIRLAIMGGEPERAERATAKIRDAVGTFLSTELEIAPPIAAMGPTGAWSLSRGPSKGDAEPILDAWFARAEPERQSEPMHEIVHESQHQPTVRSTATPSEPPRAAQRVSLADHIPGLRPLDLPWPGPAGVEFAMDESNRLHALASESIAGLSGLTSAHAWAKRHAALIEMALSSRGGVERAGDPVLHLFTSTARSIRPLLDSEVKIHLLAKVSPGVEFFTTELN